MACWSSPLEEDVSFLFLSVRPFDSELEHEKKFLNAEVALNFGKLDDICLLGFRDAERGDDWRLLDGSGLNAGLSPCLSVARTDTWRAGDWGRLVFSDIAHLPPPRDDGLLADICESGPSPLIAPNSTNRGDASGALGNDVDAMEDIVD